MSFEVNGNSATITKRRKNREKVNSSTPKINSTDFNVPNYPNFHATMNSFPNSNIPEHAPYYFPVSYQHHAEPMSLPVYPFAYPTTVPYSTTPNIHPRGYVNSTNKYNSLQNHAPLNNNDANEYMSLPIGSLDQNENSSDKRRFSDPGVPFDSDSSSNSLDDRLVHKLTQQVSALKESNRKLNREVIEMRIELNMIKQQQNMRHFDRDYEPGMLAEVIKEIRDAARVREDALLAKVKHMIEEKQFNMNQIQLVADKSRNNERLAKLEEQLKNLSVSHNRSEDNVSLPSSSAIDESSNSARQVIELERETLLLRRELQDARAKREESDQKLIQLDKKLTNLLRQKEAVRSDMSEDGKTTTSADTFSLTTMSSGPGPLPVSVVPQRVTLTGPVTDL